MKKSNPHINKQNIGNLLESIYNLPVQEIEEIHSGKIKRVFFFKCNDKSYVIRFSEDNIEFKIEQYLQQSISDNEFPIPKTFHVGKYYDLYYSITQKVEGTPLHYISKEELLNALPSIIETMTKFHFLDMSFTTGYGWPDIKLNGCYNNFVEYIEGNFSNDLEGYWQGWYELFENSFLDYSIFNVLYDLMMELAPYCEGKRHLAHTDFHYDHVLISDCKVVGIIDWGRVRYVDFLFDVVTIVMQFPSLNLISYFKNYYKANNIKIPNFDERFICAAICQSLDGMRFWAKMGREESYNSILDSILSLLKNRFNMSIR